ncbi:MAG: histidine kinase [Deltaproteobacteria bacterium]|nr:MAG: histidine kinase [Deltaproteobacteria bacterium]
MGIITISRGSYSNGKFIAEQLARELGYECVSRDIIMEASEHFNVPELKLIRAIHDAPNLLDRMNYTKEKYIAYIREAFYDHMRHSNIVYHGLAGQFLLQGVPNVLKVRIIANFEDRVREEMQREGIGADEARHILKKDDEERRKWSSTLYGIDTADPTLYDILIHIDTIQAEKAVEILKAIADRPCFQDSPQQRQVLSDKYLEAKVTVALLGKFPGVKVHAEKSTVMIQMENVLFMEDRVKEQITQIVNTVDGVKEIHVGVTPMDID